MPGSRSSAARRWADALASWAIPDRILSCAPEDPWALPVALFRTDASPAVPNSTSHQRVAEALPAAGSLLDVGCGGGAASIPLAERATAIIGVDVDQEMLVSFASAATAAGVAHREVHGRWPDVADQTPAADVVVCFHVVYNVADIVPFLLELSAHARRRVVVELTARHPQTSLNSLWRRFWDLDRPTEPSADLLVQVVTAAGFRPKVDRFERAPRAGHLDRDAYVAWVRRRLCLGPERDAELDAILPSQSELSPSTVVTLYWDVHPTSWPR